MRTRHQKGHFYKKGGYWYLRYRDNMLQTDGTVARGQLSERLAPVCDQYRTERAVRPLADEFLLPINMGIVTPESTTTIERFVEDVYLPWVETQKRPSTYDGYCKMWKKHLKVRCATIRIRDFRTCTGERMMAEIARKNDLNRTSLKHIKGLLSGVFTHARRTGVLNGGNPMQGVSVPNAREAGTTYAYSLEELARMLTVLPLEPATVVACAGFAGLSRSELRGLEWPNYDDKSIRVTQAVWKTFVRGPKREARRGSIPVIPQLATILDTYQLKCCSPTAGFIFHGVNGNAADLDALARNVIRPALEEIGLKWHGWHAFRRGLATNLYRLGVPDKVIQRILRHANLSTTMNNYVKSVDDDSIEAMKVLASAMRRVTASVHQCAPLCAPPGKAVVVN